MHWKCHLLKWIFILVLTQTADFSSSKSSPNFSLSGVSTCLFSPRVSSAFSRGEFFHEDTGEEVTVEDDAEGTSVPDDVVWSESTGGSCDSNGESSDDDVMVAYSTSDVANEFIVSFNGYFSIPHRRRFIAEALSAAGLFNWTIIDRDNPAQLLPSDFDVVRLAEPDVPACLEALGKHRHVRGVSRQQNVQRSLSYTTRRSRQTPDQCSILSSQDTTTHCDISTNDSINCLHYGLPAGSSWASSASWTSRRLQMTAADAAAPLDIASLLGADVMWRRYGARGQGVRVAVFDTGLKKEHAHFGSQMERTDWTDERSLDDAVGHGTFVASVIAGRGPHCRGLAPDAQLFVMRVFTRHQTSFTSWFLDAFNYALARRVHVLNLSIGGPDYLDRPFVDKVWEMSANNVIMVSAIGNDGPVYGTLNNPADQADVVGVGGVDGEGRVARFSSRGMTAWELPAGYGRVKPDVVTHGVAVRGSSVDGGCRALSGTSVASPVVAGAVAVLLSSLPPATSLSSVSPVSVKQSLMESARRLPAASMFEQGAGQLNLPAARHLLVNYRPHVSFVPDSIELGRETECPYSWPLCSQPLYYSALPSIVNVTVLNGLAVTGRLARAPVWRPYTRHHGRVLRVAVAAPPLMWPWSGWLAVYVSVAREAADWQGVARGHLEVTVQDDSLHAGVGSVTVILPVRVRVIPTPPRTRRLLWDQFHSIHYPAGYVPRDTLTPRDRDRASVVGGRQRDPLDWHGDHVHTNFRDLYLWLRSSGYYVEVLGEPLTCFNASNYGTVMLVDSEDEFFDEEVVKLQRDVQQTAVSLLVVADWYNTSVMRHLRFFDENSRSWWSPLTGGANVPALNELLAPWHVALSDRVLDGRWTLDGSVDLRFASGVALAQFPAAGLVVRARLRDQGAEIVSTRGGIVSDAPILGLLQIHSDNNSSSSGGRTGLSSGRLAVFGDSSCLDSSERETIDERAASSCFSLLSALLHFTNTGQVPAALERAAANSPALSGDPRLALPSRPADSQLFRHSRVLAAANGRKRSLPRCVISELAAGRGEVMDTRPDGWEPRWVPVQPLTDWTDPNSARREWQPHTTSSFSLNLTQQRSTGSVAHDSEDFTLLLHRYIVVMAVCLLVVACLYARVRRACHRLVRGWRRVVAPPQCNGGVV